MNDSGKPLIKTKSAAGDPNYDPHQNTDTEDNTFNSKIYKKPPTHNTISFDHQKSATEPLQNWEFKGYSNLFKPSFENGAYLERIIDNLILNPYQLDDNESKKEVTNKISQMKDSIGEYWDNPMPSLISKPFYQDIYSVNSDLKANLKTQNKETNEQKTIKKTEKNETIESKSNQPKDSITAMNFSKSGILVYAENKHEKNEEKNLVNIIFFQNQEEKKSQKEETNQTISFSFKFGKISNLLISNDEQRLLVTIDDKIYIYSFSKILKKEEDKKNEKPESKKKENQKEEGNSDEKDHPYIMDCSQYFEKDKDKVQDQEKDKDKEKKNMISIMSLLECKYETKDCLYVWGTNGKVYLVENYNQKQTEKIVMNKISPLAPGREASFVADEAGSALIFVEALVSLTTIVICKLPLHKWHKVLIKEAHSEPITALCFIQKYNENLKFISGDKGNVIKIWQFPEKDIKERDEKEKLKKTSIDITAIAEISGVHFVGEVYSLDCFEDSDFMHVLSLSSDKHLRIWSVEKNPPKNQPKEVKESIEESKLGNQQKSQESRKTIIEKNTKNNNNNIRLSGSFYQKEKFWFIKSFISAKTKRRQILTMGKRTLRVYDYESVENSTQNVRMHFATVRALCLTPNGKTVISASEDRYITLWDAQTLCSIKSFWYEDKVNSMKVTGDGRYLISGANDKCVRLYDLELMEKGLSRDVDQGPINHIHLARNPETKVETEIISVGFNIKVLNLRRNFTKEPSMSEKFFIDGDGKEEILAFTMTTDGRKMISGGTKKNSKIRIWDIRDFQRKCKEIGQEESESPLMKDPKSFKYTKLEKEGNKVMKFIHPCETLENKHTKAINSLAVSPDNEKLVSGGADRKIFLWNLANGDCIAEFEEEKEINILRYFPNGNYMLAGTAEAVIKVYDMKHNNSIGKLEGHSKGIKALVISKNGEMIYSGSSDQTMRVWSMKTKYDLNWLEGHCNTITQVIIGAKNFFTCSLDSSIRIWDIATGRQEHVLKRHKNAVLDMVYNEKVDFLVSVGLDGLRFWEIKTRTEVESRDTDNDEDQEKGKALREARTLALSKSGELLVTASRTKISLWRWQQNKFIFSTTLETKEIKLTSPIVVMKLVDESLLVLGDKENNLSKWEFEVHNNLVGEIKVKILYQHSKPITSIEISEKNICLTCGGEIIVWKDNFEKKIKIPTAYQAKFLVFAAKNEFGFDDEKDNGEWFYYVSGENNIIHCPTSVHEEKEEKTFWEKSKLNIKLNEQEIVGLQSKIEKIAVKENTTIIIYDNSKISIYRNDNNNNLKVHSNRISAMELEKEGKLMFSGSRDGYFMVWKLPECTAIFSERAHDDEIFSIREFGENLLASAGYDNQILVWKSEKMENHPNQFDQKEISLVKRVNINSEKNLRKLFITSMVPYSINDEKRKINLLIVGTKEKFIEIFDADKDPRSPVSPANANNQKIRIYYKENNKNRLEKNQPEKNFPKEKTKDEAMKRREIKKFTRSATIKIKEDENYEDLNYPVALLALSNMIILGTRSGDIYVINKKEEGKSESKEKNGFIKKTCQNFYKGFQKKSLQKNVKELNLENILRSQKTFDSNSFDGKNYEPVPQKEEKQTYYAELRFKGHTKQIVSLITSSDKKRKKLISNSLDNTIRFWDLETGNLLQNLNMGDLVDFQISQPCFLVEDRLLMINNLVYDILNELIVYHGESKITTNQKLYCAKTRSFYSYDKLTGIFSQCSLIDNNLLYYMREYSKPFNFFANKSDNTPMHRTLTGSCMLYPYYCNFLHLNAIFLNNEKFVLNNLSEIEGISMGAFIHQNSLSQSPISILLESGNKVLLKNYFVAFFKAFQNHKTDPTQQMRFFHHRFKYYKFDDNKIKHEPQPQNKVHNDKTSGVVIPEGCMYQFMKTLMKTDKKEEQDLSIVSDILTHSLIDLKVETLGQELSEPIFQIIGFDELVQEKIIEKIKNSSNSKRKKAGTSDNYALIKAKVIGLPNIMDITNQPVKEFFEELILVNETNSIFGNPSLRMLTYYKWKKIYQREYKWKLLESLFILSLFLANFAYLLPLRLESMRPITITICTILDAILIFYFCLMFYREMKKAWKLKWKYFRSFWNIVDLALVFLVNASTASDMANMGYPDLTLTGPKIIYSYAMFLLWIRITSFFRGFEKTGFLLRLIFRVIYDIRFFLLFILIFILGFTYSAYLLQTDLVYNYDQFDVFKIFYRLILGDFNQFDSFNDEQVEIPYFLWILLMFTTILMTIILLNLLISIIQMTFNKVVEAEESMKTYEGLLLINDFEVRKYSKIQKEGKMKYLLYIYNETNEEKKKKVEIDDVMESVEVLKNTIEKENSKEGNKPLMSFQKKDENVSLEAILKGIEDLQKKFEKEKYGNIQEIISSNPKKNTNVTLEAILGGIGGGIEDLQNKFKYLETYLQKKVIEKAS